MTIMDHGWIVAEGTPRELKRQVVGDSVILGLVDDGLVERASALLRSEPFIRDIGVEDGRLRLYVNDGSAALPGLLRLLDREQIGLRSISLSEPTLDDVFLRHTGRSLRNTGHTPEVAA
jgi:ABC-2 type transport system ATP-binding protein